jgi:hypothetical protein
VPDLRKVSPLFTNCREEVFSETSLPVSDVLGNSEGVIGIRRAGVVRLRLFDL